MYSYDVVIVGGGTAGCACAWNCGKLGLKTLLIEKENYLGGTMTGALVVPVMKSGNNQINTDFYNELIKKMKAKGGQITYQDNPGWFNPILLKDVLFLMLSEVGVEILFNFTLSPCNFSIYTNNIYIEKIKMLSEYIDAKYFVKGKIKEILLNEISSQYFVDATGDGVFSKLCGGKFLDNNNSFQPVSLRFIMSNIDLSVFGNWLLGIDSDREVTTVEKINGETHLSTAYTWDRGKKWALAPIFDKAVENGDLKDEDRNYFQVFTIAGMEGTLAFNCPRITTKVNPNSKSDLDNARKLGLDSIKRLANFCIKYFPGFEKAEIYKIADKIGVRSSNQVRGKYIYTINDLRSGKTFDSPVLISDYPVDVHNAKKDLSTLELTKEYQLPIESLMVEGFDNLFVIGRCLSADSMAQGALRVQSSCFSMGEGVAKYISKSF